MLYFSRGDSPEGSKEDSYAKILRRYLRFDDEMSVIAVVWRDCHQLLDSYNEEQVIGREKKWDMMFLSSCSHSLWGPGRASELISMLSCSAIWIKVVNHVGLKRWKSCIWYVRWKFQPVSRWHLTSLPWSPCICLACGTWISTESYSVLCGGHQGNH